MNARSRFRGAIAAVALLVLAPAAAWAAIEPGSLPQNPVGGSAVFVEKRCLECHSIQGYGGTRGPDLGRLQLSGGFLGMAGFMWNHAPKMITALAQEKVSLPRFSVEEMTQLVAFLYTLNYLDPPGNAREGEDVFAAKQCARCHSVGGKGGSIGPALDGYAQFVSPLFVATALWNKGPAMAKEMDRERIRRPFLTGRDVRDIVAFIRTRSKPASGGPSRVFVQPGNPRVGASLFKSKGCSGCHGEGNGKGGPVLRAQKFKVSLSTIAGRMWDHGPGMWSMWREKNLAPISFTVQEMADVTAYLYFLQFESPKGEPARGAVLFNIYGCGSCHHAEEQRRSLGPDLRTKGPWANDVDLAREMWNHAANMYSMLLGSAREWPKLNEKEVADLLAYIRSIGGTHKVQKERKN